MHPEKLAIAGPAATLGLQAINPTGLGRDRAAAASTVKFRAVQRV